MTAVQLETSSPPRRGNRVSTGSSGSLCRPGSFTRHKATNGTTGDQHAQAHEELCLFPLSDTVQACFVPGGTGDLVCAKVPVVANPPHILRRHAGQKEPSLTPLFYLRRILLALCFVRNVRTGYGVLFQWRVFGVAGGAWLKLFPVVSVPRRLCAGAAAFPQPRPRNLEGGHASRNNKSFQAAQKALFASLFFSFFLFFFWWMDRDVSGPSPQPRLMELVCCCFPSFMRTDPCSSQ